MTLLSRVSGLVRDVAFASLLGAGTGIAADAFYVAFRIPNFLRRIFAEGAFSQAFVPVMAEYRANGNMAAAKAFVDHIAGLFGVILLVVTLIGLVAAPLVVSLLAPGFLGEPEKYGLTVDMLRIVFPYIFFISFVAMSAGILNTFRRFGVAEFTSVLLNVCLVVAALWLAPRMSPPVMALAWGVFAAGVIQLLFQFPFLARLSLLPRPRLALKTQHEGVARVAKLMLPAVFGASIAQVNLLVNTLLASFLVTGSVSWLYYSDRLMEFPLGVFGIALATVILPSLAHQHATDSREEFSRLLDWALRVAILIGVPATVGLVALSGPLITTIYYHGRFTLNDVEMSSLALTAFAVGLPGFILIKVLAPGFYARHDTKTPMRIGAIAMAVNVVLSLALIVPFKHVGLAMAISIAAFVNAWLLYRWLRRHDAYRPLSGWGVFLARVFAASAVMGALLIWGAGPSDKWLHADTLTRVARLAFLVFAGIVVYGISVFALGLRPKQMLIRREPGMFLNE
jgi:putative peptidoglycan lipid II flippase